MSFAPGPGLCPVPAQAAISAATATADASATSAADLCMSIPSESGLARIADRVSAREDAPFPGRRQQPGVDRASNVAIRVGAGQGRGAGKRERRLLRGAGQELIRLADRVPETLDPRRVLAADELLDDERESVEEDDREDREADEYDAHVEEQRALDEGAERVLDVVHGLPTVTPSLARGYWGKCAPCWRFPATRAPSNSSNSTLPASIAARNTSPFAEACPASTSAGPGQMPARPHPTPKITLPSTRRRSIVRAPGSRTGAPSSECVFFRMSANAAAPTPTAPAMTSASEGSHAPATSRKPSTLA